VSLFRIDLFRLRANGFEMTRSFWPALLVIAAFGQVTPAATAATCDASSFIAGAGGAFMTAARNGSAGAFAGAASRYADLHGIAMFALGPHRKLLKRSSEAEYVSLTRSFIGRVMAENSSRLAGNGLTVTDCSGDKSAMIVNTKMSSGKKLVFKVYKTKGGYRVRDVNVSSVWLAQQLRSKFTGVISRNNGNIDALFAYLRQ
jgi:phospholipid transport system substrate-binding protein